MILYIKADRDRWKLVMDNKNMMMGIQRSLALHQSQIYQMGVAASLAARGIESTLAPLKSALSSMSGTLNIPAIS